MKILVSTPTEYDSTSFYRCWGVLHNLNKDMGGKLQLDSFSRGNYDWSKLSGYDILFLHRPSSAVVLNLVQYCKQIGVKVWVDYDDNLFNLPYENRAYDNYKLDVKKLMRTILENADIITVSTQPLADFFKHNLFIPNPIEVIPNALNDRFFKMAEKFNEDKNYFWRGSETHYGDILDFTNEIYEGIANTTVPWYFVGYKPHILMRNFGDDRLKYVEPQDPILYHSTFKSLKPHIMHVPLSSNALNESKSNIAWIEATYAGAVTIAPDWKEWKMPGVLNYKSNEEYQSLLINPPSNLAELWKQSHDYIKENLLLSKVNQKRKTIIENL